MSSDNQIEIPPSFMALYLTRGRTTPSAPEEVVIARYEQCEDMACALTESAQTLALSKHFNIAEVLARCHQGLLAEGSSFAANEAAWVIVRLTELLGWEGPTQ